MELKNDFKMIEPELCLVDERELFADREYMVGLYPARARLIMVMIEDECDKLEYQGSPMFAAFPDREYIRQTADKIYNKICYGNDENLRFLVEVMLCNEYLVRRSRYKRRRKYF